ncbi:serine hydrolase domain-containing protein [Colwelliaceae bacterium 6471]
MRIKFILLLILALFFNPHSKADETNPSAVAKITANKLTKAVNSNRYDDLLEFAKSSTAETTLNRIGGPESYADYLSAESFFHGALLFDSAEIVSNTNGVIQANAFVRSKNTELQYRVELSISEKAPNKITRLRLRAAPAIQTQENKLPVDQAIEKFSHYVDRLSERDVFSGSVLIAKNNAILFEKTTGWSSKRFHTLNNASTRFNLGSMNKMYTSVTILRLIERGELKLTTPLHQLLNIVGKDQNFKDIQIQHLLSHSSGVGRLDCKKGEDSIVDSMANCLNKLSEISLNFPPGTQYRYSSDGMFILGLVIEHLTKSTYYQAIQKEIFAPADMTDSSCLDLQYPVENVAIGYYYHARKQMWRNNLFIHDQKGGPAGGCYSSAKDLFKFSSALQSNSLLSQPMTALATSAKPQFGAQNYGFGFIVRDINGDRVVGHNGSFPGVSAQLDMNLDSGYTITVLSNHSFAADPVIAKFNQLF